MQEHETAQILHEAAHTAHEAGAHAAEAPHEAHELPNLFTILNDTFPDAVWTQFLHQWENVLFAGTAALLICAVAIGAAKKKSLIPEGAQNFCEAVVEGVEGFVVGILGPQGTKFVPFLGTVFLWILLMNWSGLVPLMKSPTASWGTTLAVALATMVYVQYTGIKEQGLGHYLKHIAGNPQNVFGIVLVPLMLVINLTVEFVAVPLSLSLRLFANVSSEDRLLFNFAHLTVQLTPFLGLFQLFANVLAIAFSLVQAFVFMLLSTVYISLILPHEPHGHGEEEHDASPQHAAHAH
jgi:F-type H+-transporting ATPase subunit a